MFRNNEGYGQDRSHYKVGMACLSGHPITGDAEGSARASEFCEECGERTITECPHCHAKIRGKLYVPNVVSFSNYKPAAYCYSCGKPYPWTEKKLKAAVEYASLLDELTEAEKKEIEDDVRALTRDTPEGKVAALRFSKKMKKVGVQAAAVFRDILVDVLSEAAKKAIWPDSK